MRTTGVKNEHSYGAEVGRDRHAALVASGTVVASIFQHAWCLTALELITARVLSVYDLFIIKLPFSLFQWLNVPCITSPCPLPFLVKCPSCRCLSRSVYIFN